MKVNYCQTVTPVVRALTRSIEHQEDSMAGKWQVPGATEHSKECHGRFNWLHPKALPKLSNINERKIRESLKYII